MSRKAGQICLHGVVCMDYAPLIDGVIFHFILENLIRDVFECTDMLIESLQNAERERGGCFFKHEIIIMRKLFHSLIL